MSFQSNRKTAIADDQTQVTQLKGIFEAVPYLLTLAKTLVLP